MKSIKIMPSVLKGKIDIPPSKSLSHRAIICASLCNDGQSIINNLLFSEDIKATADGMKKLGSEMNIENSSAYIKRNNVIEKNPVISCGESGSTLRFLIPLSLMLTDSCIFTGSRRLFERPLDVYYDIFAKQQIDYNAENERLILRGSLSPGTYVISGSISSQFISGLLFSLPLLEGDSKIVIDGSFESKSYVQMTIDVIRHYGIHIDETNEKTFLIKGRQKYKSTTYTIERDYSQTAFFLAANELGNEVECPGLNADSLQGDKEIINIINKYGCLKDETAIDASQIPDLVPIIAVMASLKNNHTTVITNARRLRLKESDRLKAISTELGKLGASIRETEDGLIIKGKQSLKGNAKVNSWNDHRIAMSLAVAATKCENEIILENHMAVSKSYPHFWEDYKSLGGVIYELNNRK